MLQDVHGDLGGDGHGCSSMRMSARRPNSLHRQHLDGAPAARSAAKAVSGRPKTGVSCHSMAAPQAMRQKRLEQCGHRGDDGEALHRSRGSWGAGQPSKVSQLWPTALILVKDPSVTGSVGWWTDLPLSAVREAGYRNEESVDKARCVMAKPAYTYFEIFSRFHAHIR